jgi:peptidoglycan hydrolase-like protein with peptidoglycan-binding domain
MRRIVLAITAALAVTAAPAQAKPLKRGDRGPAVVRLQRALHVHADGVLGRATVRALKRFQRRHGLRADGVAGPATRRALRGRAGSAHRVVRRGPSVRLAQRRLGVAADGVFGPGTRRAVKAFQRAHGMPADGVVGPATWSALGVSGRHPVLRSARVRGHRGGGGSPSAVSAALRGANRIAGAPYKFGGGHGTFSDSGYDCSGSVSYVLHAAGVLSSPLDSGQLMSFGAPGRGRHITVYANPGHAFVVIHGRRFDTTGRGDSGSRWQASMRSTAGYVVRHPPGL